MLYSEFTQRTGFFPTEKIFREIENEYMASDLDKDTFCKEWKRKGGIAKASKQMVADMESLFKMCQGVDWYALQREKNEFKAKYPEISAKFPNLNKFAIDETHDRIRKQFID